MTKAVGITRSYLLEFCYWFWVPLLGWDIFPHSVSLIASYQREHYKLDWHRFNLKQRLKNKPFLSALDFEKQSSTGDDDWWETCVEVGHGGE